MLDLIAQIDPGWVSVGISVLALLGAAGSWIYQLWQKNLKARANQADAVTAWIGDYSGSTNNVAIRNDSGAPIYEVVLTVVGMYGAGPSRNGEDQPSDYSRRSLYVIAPPGISSASVDLRGAGGMHVTCSLEIAFVDGNGQSWVRRGDGKLKQIKKRPFEFYGIPLPAEQKYSPDVCCPVALSDSKPA